MLWNLLRRLFGRRPVAGEGQPSPFDGTSDWLKRLPASVAFCDVETTGLSHTDRIVSFGGIGLRTAALASGKFDISFSYLVFDPGKKSHPKAEQVHGYSEWTLRFQDPFSLYAEEIFSFLASYELLVAHNAEFDFEFLDREMMLVGLPTIPQPIYCTMQGYRQLGLGGSASLSAVCQRINLTRTGSLHGAIEDAWLAMQIYLWLHSCPIRADLPEAMRQPPSNLRDVPPILKRVPARERLVHASIS